MALNDYVRKGEFDRRVKLIEEKLRFFKDDDLQERLDALNQYYIDQLRNTNLNIDVLRQDLENAISEEGAVDANIEALLNSFVTGYNNFAANTLRFNDVFDADGQFTGKIRPLSVETAALSVGTRSQQLALNGIEFRVIPYNSGNGTLEVVASINSKNGSQSGTAGYMFHYGFGTDTDPKIYKINEQSFPINDNSAYYIYVKLPYTHNDVYTEVGSSFNINDYKLHIGELYIRGGSDPNYTYTKVLTYTAGTYYKNAGTNEKPIYSQVEITEDNYFNNVFELYTKSGENYNPVSTPSYDNTKTYCTKSTEDVITYNESVVDNNVATIFIDKNQIKLEDISGYLTIKLGYISQPFDSAKIADATTTPKTYYKQRKVDMTYGSTTIDGRLITTGRIEGNGAYFDLDLGEIGGKITFRNNTTESYDDINNIVDGTTVIAGGMISSNKILLKPLYDIIPNFSTSKAYYYLENNIYKQFPFVYTDGPHVGEIKEEFLIKGYNNIVVYPKNWGSDSYVYEYINGSYEGVDPVSTSSSDDIISAGICGEKSLPAFWAGGSDDVAENVATIRNLYPSKSSHQARMNAYISSSLEFPDVFIDHDGFAKFGDFWVCDGVVSTDITVNLSGNKVTGVLPISKGGTNANSQSSAFTNIVAPGGTMTTGQIKKTGGGMWIKGRDNAVIFGNSHGQTTGSSWNTVWSQKTTNGAWTAGNLSGDDILRFVYDTDTNYNNNNNNSTYDIKFPSSSCKLAYLSDSDTYTSGNVVVASSSSTGAIKTSSYTISSSVNAGTANCLAYYSGANAISSTSNLVVSGNTINLPQVNNVALNFRPDNSNYSGWIAYETGGNEAMVFGTKNANTSFIFANTTSEANVSTTQWQSLTPALQIKQNCVYINSLIGQNVTPSYNLYVNGTSCFTNNLYIDNTRGIRIGNNATPSVYQDVMRLDGSNAFIIGNGTSASGYTTYLDGNIVNLRYGTSHTSGLYLNASGNIGIGTTSPSQKLSVSGNIYASGGVTALASVSSDKRLKKNIKSFNATEIVEKLKPVEFEWNNKAKKYNSNFKDGKNYGLIAQDSDGIIDNLVFDLPDGKGYKGVRYEKLIPILLQAIKEQQKEINELKKILKK